MRIKKLFIFLKSLLKSFFQKDDIAPLYVEMQKEVTNEIEKLFVQANNDIEKRRQFYKLFLETEFYFLGEIENAQEKATNRMIVTGENAIILFPVFPIAGRDMNAFFTSFEKLQKSVEGRSYKKYVQCKFKDFFNDQYRYPFIMNPGHLMVKIFEPQEIISILDQSIFLEESKAKVASTPFLRQLV